jgi:hypothetical protein
MRERADDPKRWGLEVEWGATAGAVRFRDPWTGERIEVEGKWLKSEHKHLDLRWMARRAAARGRAG